MCGVKEVKYITRVNFLLIVLALVSFLAGEEMKLNEKTFDSKKLVYRWYVMNVHDEDENGTMRSY